MVVKNGSRVRIPVFPRNRADAFVSMSWIPFQTLVGGLPVPCLLKPYLSPYISVVVYASVLERGIEFLLPSLPCLVFASLSVFSHFTGGNIINGSSDAVFDFSENPPKKVKNGYNYYCVSACYWHSLAYVEV